MIKIRRLFFIIMCIIAATCSKTLLASDIGFTIPAHTSISSELINPYLTIDKPINISDQTITEPFLKYKTQFNQAIDYINTSFLKRVNLHLAVFMKKIKFQNVMLDSNFNISWAIFHDAVSIYSTSFNGSMSFFNCIFSAITRFDHITAKEEAIFSGSKFEKDTYFSGNMFVGKAFFYGARFKQKLHIKSTEFLQGVNFSGAKFEKDVVFDSSVFRQHTIFSGASFNGEAIFNRSAFSGLLDFSYVTQIKSTINLTLIEHKKRGEKIRINLIGADISKFNLEYTDFVLYFPKNSLYSDKIYVYKSLLNSFRQRGYLNSYALLYPEFREFEYLTKGQKFSNFIQKNWWNYGLNKEKVFQWMAWLLLFFTAINALFFLPLVRNYCSVPFLEKTTYDYSINSNILLRYIYYFPRAFLLTIILFFGGTFRLGIRTKDFKSNNLLVNIYLMLMLVSGFICMFFMFKYLLG